MGIVTRSCAVQLSTRCMYKPERRPLGPILATPPIKPNKPHFADPTGGYPPESALGLPQPYNSILDERRAFRSVRLRAALVTGGAVVQLMDAAEMFRHHLSVVTSNAED